MEVILTAGTSNESRSHGGRHGVEKASIDKKLARTESATVQRKLLQDADRESATSSDDQLAAVTRCKSFPPSSSGRVTGPRRKRRPSRRRKPTERSKSRLGPGTKHDSGSFSGVCLTRTQLSQRRLSTTAREKRRKNSRSGSHSRIGVPPEHGTHGSGEASAKDRHLTEDLQAQYTLDEYSSAIFGDELTEEWTEIESFSDVDDDDLILQEEAEEKLYQRHQQIFPSRSLPVVERSRFALSTDRLRGRNGMWGGQGGPGTDIAALGFMSDLAPPPGETDVVCNPLFMNHKAQDMLSSKKKAWNVPSGEDTLVKRLNPLYQNLLLTALLEESRQEWPLAVSKKKNIFPLRKKQSLSDMKAYQRPDKPEKKTENPLYRKVITNDAYTRLRKD